MARRASLPRVCIALGFPDVKSLLQHARSELEAGESILEIRLDYLLQPMDGVAAIRTLVRDNPECTLLATCRRHQNQGRFNGSIEEHLRILEAATDAGARAVDVEIESAENATVGMQVLRGKTLVI